MEDEGLITPLLMQREVNDEGSLSPKLNDEGRDRQNK